MRKLALLFAALAITATGGSAAATSPAPGALRSQYRYTWTATNGRQFTAAEYAKLAGFSIVILEKSHGSSFQDWDAAARELERRNPHQKVFANFLANAANGTFLRRWGSSFKDEWILRNDSGTKIPNLRQGRQAGWRVDLTNPDYRHFLESQIEERMRSAPYDGVMLDSFHVPDPGGSRALGPAEAARQSTGLSMLAAEVKRVVGPGKLVYFNGVARGQTTRAGRDDRGFDFLTQADGAQDEFYCYLDTANVFRDPQQTAADTLVYRRYSAAGSTILYSVKLRNDAARAAQAHVKRFCFANFLIGYVPGRSFIQFKEYGSETAGPQIESAGSPEQRIALGTPTALPARTGTVARRRFALGWVFVNLGATASRVSLPADLTLWNGDVRGRSLRRGQTYLLPARDAAFFLNR